MLVSGNGNWILFELYWILDCALCKALWTESSKLYGPYESTSISLDSSLQGSL